MNPNDFETIKERLLKLPRFDADWRYDERVPVTIEDSLGDFLKVEDVYALLGLDFYGKPLEKPGFQPKFL